MKIKQRVLIFFKKDYCFARYQHYIYIVARSLMFLIMAPRTDMMSLWFNLENKWSKNHNILHSLPLTGSGRPEQSTAEFGMATLHLEPVLSHSVYSKW